MPTKLSHVTPGVGIRGPTGAVGPTGPQGSAGAGTPTSGLIAMWAGTLATIPSGFVLCDGTNGTPDLRDRFVKGAPAATDPGGTGGSATHTHSDHALQSHSGAAVADHPALSHSGFAVADHSYASMDGDGKGDWLMLWWTHSVVSQPSQHAAVSHTVSAQPSDHAAQSHVAANNLPAYYAVAFIMKT